MSALSVNLEIARQQLAVAVMRGAIEVPEEHRATIAEIAAAVGKLQMKLPDGEPEKEKSARDVRREAHGLFKTDGSVFFIGPDGTPSWRKQKPGWSSPALMVGLGVIGVLSLVMAVVALGIVLFGN